MNKQGADQSVKFFSGRGTPVLGRLAEKVVRKINENELEVMLANLKAATEQ